MKRTERGKSNRAERAGPETSRTERRRRTEGTRRARLRCGRNCGSVLPHLARCELIWGIVKRTTQWVAGGRISRWDETRRTPKPPDGGLGGRSRIHERPSAHRWLLHAGGDVLRIAGRRPAYRRQMFCVSPADVLHVAGRGHAYRRQATWNASVSPEARHGSPTTTCPSA